MSRRAAQTFPGWQRGWALPDRRPIGEWARAQVRLGGGYARQGGFDLRTCRHLEEPFAAAQDEGVREITLRAALQTLKTLFVEVYSLWAIANEPGPMMWTMQDDDAAKEQAKGRYNALLRACAPCAALMPRNRHDNATTEKYFGEFYLLMNGANLNNLQSKSIRHKLNSECWLWKAGLLTHARRRVAAYERDGISKVISESQGSHADDDFDKLWHEGTQQLWAVPCAACGAVRPLRFFARLESDEKQRAGVVWDGEAKRADGTWDESLVRASARYACPACGHAHENTARTRATWNATGSYTAPRPGADPRHRSYAWNALLADDLGKLAQEFIAAGEFKRRGVLQPLKDFYMQRLGLPWKEEHQDAGRVEILTISDYTLFAISERPAEKLEHEARRFMTIDRQRDHFWAVVRAWRADGSSRLLWRGKVLTVEQAEEIRARHGVEKQLGFEDAQYDTAQVYGDCVRFGWTALHGAGEDGFTHLLRGGRKVQRFYSDIKKSQVPGGAARYMFWASDPVKDMLAALLGGKSYRWEIAADAGEEYLHQLKGEAKRERVNKRTGRSEWRWVKTGPNHYWDCEAMQVACALALQILPSPDLDPKSLIPPEEKKDNP